MWSQAAKYSSLWCSTGMGRLCWPLCLRWFILQQLRLLFITFLFINVGFSMMCLFKDLQEVAYPGVHPHAEVSWDLEFMGTRSSFPTLVSFLHVFTSCRRTRSPPLITFNPTATAISLIADLAAATLFLSPSPKSLSEHPSYAARRLNDLSAAHFRPVLLSCARLDSPESA